MSEKRKGGLGWNVVTITNVASRDRTPDKTIGIRHQAKELGLGTIHCKTTRDMVPDKSSRGRAQDHTINYE